MLSPYIKVNNLVNPANNIYTFSTSLFLINSTPVLAIRDVSWNIPSSSISAEMMAYLVFGSLVVYIHRSNQVRSRNAWYGLMIIVSLTELWSVSNSFQINYGFLRGIPGFFTGVLCYNLFSNTHMRVREWSPVLFSITEIVSLNLIALCIYNGEIMKP